MTRTRLERRVEPTKEARDDLVEYTWKEVLYFIRHAPGKIAGVEQPYDEFCERRRHNIEDNIYFYLTTRTKNLPALVYERFKGTEQPKDETEQVMARRYCHGEDIAYKTIIDSLERWLESRGYELLHKSGWLTVNNQFPVVPSTSFRVDELEKVDVEYKTYFTFTPNPASKKQGQISSDIFRFLGAVPSVVEKLEKLKKRRKDKSLSFKIGIDLPLFLRRRESLIVYHHDRNFGPRVEEALQEIFGQEGLPVTINSGFDFSSDIGYEVGKSRYHASHNQLIARIISQHIIGDLKVERAARYVEKNEECEEEKHRKMQAILAKGKRAGRAHSLAETGFAYYSHPDVTFDIAKKDILLRKWLEARIDEVSQFSPREMFKELIDYDGPRVHMTEIEEISAGNSLLRSLLLQ